MKKNIVILFGAVTDEQYQPLGDAMRKQSVEPSVVRVPADMAGSEVFLLRALDEFNANKGSYGAPGSDQYVNDRAPELQAAYLRTVLGDDATHDDIKAMVYPICPEYGTDQLWRWLTEDVDDNVAVYDVQASDTGDSYWLSGCGFGEILELVTP